MKKSLILIVMLFVNIAFSQISFDRTRVILDSSKSTSQSIVLSNTTDGPYLAQSWVEDDMGQKITSPLAALPLLQRVDPGQEKQLKISIMGSTSELASDRETMFFLNVLGVPPKLESGNQLSIAVQSKMKLFYRPKGLPQYKQSSGWVEDVIAHRSNNSLTLENPTPYHIIIYAFSRASGKDLKQDVILKPFSSETIAVNVGNNFSMMIVNDFGSGSRVNFNCGAGTCSGVLEKRQ